MEWRCLFRKEDTKSYYPQATSRDNLVTLLCITWTGNYSLPWTGGARIHEYVSPQPYGHGQYGRGQRRTRSTAAWCRAWGECTLHMNPNGNHYARRQRHHEYLSERMHRQYFWPGNASQPYPTQLRSLLLLLTLPTQRPQWVHLTGLTWPLPFLERPWFLQIVNHPYFGTNHGYMTLGTTLTFSWKAYLITRVIW